MKCVRLNSGKIERINNEKAQFLVNHDSAQFIPKSIWKKEVRNKVNVEEETISNKNKSSENVKGKSRKTLKTEK
jgi:hypothetical protein